MPWFGAPFSTLGNTLKLTFTGAARFECLRRLRRHLFIRVGSTIVIIVIIICPPSITHLTISTGMQTRMISSTSPYCAYDDDHYSVHRRRVNRRCIPYRQGSGVHGGVRHQQNPGPDRSIVKEHARRGFANVCESGLEGILRLQKTKVPDADESVDRTLELKMACIAAVEPEWTDEQAWKALSKGFIAENPDTYKEFKISAGQLAEVVANNEAKDVHAFAAALSQVKAKKKLMQASIKLKHKTYFKATKPVKVKEAWKKQPRWLPGPNPTCYTVSAWLKKFIPPTVDLQTDEYNGRYRVIGPELQWRSISWTKRGFQKSAAEVLSEAWMYHHDHTGVECPFDLDELNRVFAAEGVA